MNDLDLSGGERVIGWSAMTDRGYIVQTNTIDLDPGSMADAVLLHWLEADGFTILGQRIREGRRDYAGRPFRLTVTSGELRAVAQLRDLLAKKARELPRAL